MIYLALLRGINVGGNRKVDMLQLQALCEELGLAHVQTYINTGNVIFTSRKKAARLQTELEQAIVDRFGFAVPVQIRTKTEITNLVQQLPERWTNDNTMKSDVLFLWSAVDTESVIETLPVREGIDTVMYVPGAVLWNVDRDNQTKSGLQKIVGTKFYKQVTIRNVNTVRKIYGLLQ